jgi:hypothetical protein
MHDPAFKMYVSTIPNSSGKARRGGLSSLYGTQTTHATHPQACTMQHLLISTPCARGPQGRPCHSDPPPMYTLYIHVVQSTCKRTSIRTLIVVWWLAGAPHVYGGCHNAAAAAAAVAIVGSTGWRITRCSSSCQARTYHAPNRSHIPRTKRCNISSVPTSAACVAAPAAVV